MPVYFHTEGITFRLKQPALLKKWIQSVIEIGKKQPSTLNFIFCSDEYLLKMNRQYLEHDYYTDIITFDQSEDKSVIAGDIYISIDRVKENAGTGNFDDELHRVMVHGVLHLLGYSDKTPAEKKQIRKMEDICLEKLANL